MRPTSRPAHTCASAWLWPGTATACTPALGRYPTNGQPGVSTSPSPCSATRRSLSSKSRVNGLDPEGIHWVRELFETLAAEDRTAFVSSHPMSEMALTADHLIVIGRGSQPALKGAEATSSLPWHRLCRARVGRGTRCPRGYLDNPSGPSLRSRRLATGFAPGAGHGLCLVASRGAHGPRSTPSSTRHQGGLTK
jgi:hypothetical protein